MGSRYVFLKTKLAFYPQVSATALNKDRNTATSAAAEETCSVASASAENLTLDHGARWTWIWFGCSMTAGVALPQIVLCAVIMGYVWMDFASAKGGKTHRNDILDNSASAATLTAPDLQTSNHAQFNQPGCSQTTWADMIFSCRLCGGRGSCVCDQCVCDEGWTNEDCSCYMGTENCLAKNQMLCNGRGVCECGLCKCQDPHYFGPTCETCPTCPGPCLMKADCIECLVFGTGPKKAV